MVNEQQIKNILNENNIKPSTHLIHNAFKHVLNKDKRIQTYDDKMNTLIILLNMGYNYGDNYAGQITYLVNQTFKSTGQLTLTNTYTLKFIIDQNYDYNEITKNKIKFFKYSQEFEKVHRCMRITFKELGHPKFDIHGINNKPLFYIILYSACISLNFPVKDTPSSYFDKCTLTKVKDQIKEKYFKCLNE
jgi:hypothetical protein